MSEQHVMAGAHQLSTVTSLHGEPLGIGNAVPLLDETVTVFFVRCGHGNDRLLKCRVMTLTDADGEHKLAGAINAGSAEVHFAKDGDVAIRGRAKFPVHAVVVHHIVPAVTCSYEAAACPRKAATGQHGQRPLIFPGEQHTMTGNIDYACSVTGASAVEMWRQQGVDLEARHQVVVAFEAYMLQDHGVMGVADDLFGERIAAVRIPVYVAHT